MNARKAIAKKTYRMNSPKCKGHMTIVDDGRALVLFAESGEVSAKVFANEEDARSWASRRFNAEFSEDVFLDLLNTLLNLQKP